MKRKLTSLVLALAVSSAAHAQTICYTNAPDCAGTWTVTNTTAEQTCYVILWASGGTKNFCLQPGESASEYVRSGDSVCFAQLYTPNANTCSRQAMAARP